MRSGVLALFAGVTLALLFGSEADALVGFGGQVTCDTGLRVACLGRLPSAPAVRHNGWIVTPVGCSSKHLHFVAHGSRKHKAVALTFDDGPSRFTKRLLASLAARNVAGTFFVVGVNIPGREELLRGELSEGSMIGNHTFRHTLTYTKKPLHQDLKRTSRMIKRVTGLRPCLFRAPYGLIKGPLLKVARGLGLATIQWDVDPQDWRQPGVSAIVNNILTNARNGSIILMHETPQTTKALPAVIRGLRSRGFKFLTVSDLLGPEGSS